MLDTHLLKYEAQRRREENAIRRIGQIELGKQGIIASEGEYRKWRAMYDEQLGVAKAKMDKDAEQRRGMGGIEGEGKGEHAGANAGTTEA